MDVMQIYLQMFSSRLPQKIFFSKDRASFIVRVPAACYGRTSAVRTWAMRSVVIDEKKEILPKWEKGNSPSLETVLLLCYIKKSQGHSVVVTASTQTQEVVCRRRRATHIGLSCPILISSNWCGLEVSKCWCSAEANDTFGHPFVIDMHPDRSNRSFLIFQHQTLKNLCFLGFHVQLPVPSVQAQWS